MGVQQSHAADFHHKYLISPQIATSQPPQTDITQKFIASVLHLSSQANYPQLDSIINLKIRSQSKYITKILDKLESQSIKICSNHQRITVVYKQTGVNLAQLVQNRKKNKRFFTEEDVIYLIQCVLRGMNEFYKIGDYSQILTNSSIVLDTDNKFKVIDPFLITNDPYSQDRSYNKQIQHIFALKNKAISEEIRKNEIRFKFFITQTEEKKVHPFFTSLFSLACICLSMLDFEFNIQHCFDKNNSTYKDSWEFNWVKFRLALKRIKSQKLKQKMWLLSSQYHMQRVQVFEYLNKNFQNINYPIDILLKNTTFCQDLHEDINFKKDKFSLTRNQIPLNQSITFVPRNSHQLNIHQSGIIKPLTTVSSTNNSQMYTPPLANHQNSQASQHSPTKIVFANPMLMKRSLPASIINSNNVPLYSPSVIYPYNPVRPATVQSSQAIKAQDCRKNHQPYHFQILHPSIKSISSNHGRHPSMQEICSHKSFINALEDENLKIPQELYHSQKRIKTLNDLHDDQKQSIPVDKQDAQSEHSENVERVDINQVFPGYQQNLSYDEQQMSPIGFIKNFQQPPLEDILVNGVIQQDSAENSLSEHSEVEIDCEFVVEQYMNGGRYEGYKRNEMRDGYGKLYFANGQVYDGEWSKNKMHGFGKLFYDQNTLIYEGYWKEDYFNGNGKLYNLEIEPIKSLTCEFLNFSPYCNSWKTYQGDFIQDVKQGKGRLTFQNDQFYQGEFKADKISGQGFFKGKNGSVVRGQWNDWKLVKIY